MSLKLYFTAYRSLFPLVANYEGRRKDKLVDWAEGAGRTEDLMEWRKEQKEREAEEQEAFEREGRRRGRGKGKKRSRQNPGSLSRLNVVNVT